MINVVLNAYVATWHCLEFTRLFQQRKPQLLGWFMIYIWKGWFMIYIWKVHSILRDFTIANVLISLAIKLSYLISIVILQGHRVMFREPYFFLWEEVALGAICVFVLEIRENQPEIEYNFSLKSTYSVRKVLRLLIFVVYYCRA